MNRRISHKPAAGSPRAAELFRVVRAKVGVGSLELDRRLGHDGGPCPVPLCKADLKPYALISAHAPSDLVLETDRSLELFGVLNASASFDPTNPVQFWANWNFVGDASKPGATTSKLKLGPGVHRLVISCRRPDQRHTLWALRATGPVRKPDLTVLTIAAYPEWRIPAEIGLFARSARRQGVELTVCYPGEPYVSHSAMKIRRLRETIQALNTSRVLYIDGRDSLIVAGVERITAQFESLRRPIVCSTEANCWPIGDADFAARFPVVPGGCNWPNSGQWMGDRQALVRALTALEEIIELGTAGKPHPRIPDFERFAKLVHDDQLMWQLGFLYDLFDVALDYDGRVCRTVQTLDQSLVRNRDFDLSNGAVYKLTRQRPCILHFAGSAAGYCMQQWGALLEAY